MAGAGEGERLFVCVIRSLRSLFSRVCVCVCLALDSLASLAFFPCVCVCLARFARFFPARVCVPRSLRSLFPASRAPAAAPVVFAVDLRIVHDEATGAVHVVSVLLVPVAAPAYHTAAGR